MNKTIVCASITKRKLKLQRKLKLVPHRILRRWCLSSDRRRHLSADELSVFSSALRPCLRFLLDSNTKPKTFPEWRHIKNSATIAILGIASFAVFSTSPVYAENSSMTLTVPDTITVTVEPGGEMNKATGKITIDTTARYGYNINIKAKDSNTNLTSTVLNEDGTTKATHTISSITTPSTSFNANTSAWGWRYGEWSGTTGDPNNTEFVTSPNNTTGTSIASVSSDLSNPATTTTKDYYLTVGARVAGDQPKGTYTKDFVITATATEKQYDIVYNLNGGTPATGGNTSTKTYTSNVSFTTATSSKTGYNLKGWCSKATTTKDCPTGGTTCPVSGNCPLTLTSSDTQVSLYAMWETPFEKAGVSTMQGYGKLTADKKKEVLANITTVKGDNFQYELKDERDSRLYYISKLADGNLWMTENLDLALATNKTLTTSNTDIPVNWTPVRSTLTTTTSWTNDQNTPSSYDPGNRCWNGTITSTKYSTSDATAAKNCNQHDSSHYHVGNYYNWTAAVAISNTQYYNKDRQNVNQSVCPKGWQLPVYEGNKSFVNLKNVVGTFTSGSSGTIQKAPFYISYSGYLDMGTSTGVGRDGDFWSSVVRDSGAAYNFTFDYNGYLNLYNHGHRVDGFSIRCVARTGGTEDISGPKTIADISTMQQYGSLPDANKTSIKNSMTQNTQYELKDERNDRMYYIAKLVDGNIWMTESLDLDLSTSRTLTPSDTDIPSNWTPPSSTLSTSQASSWNNDNNIPYSWDAGNRCWNKAFSTSRTSILDNNYGKDCNPHDQSHYYVGNYYNFSAAVAMSNTSSKTSGKVDQSICPKGWTLPNNTGDKSLSNVVNNYGLALSAGTSGNIHNSPLYLPYSGVIDTGSSGWAGESGSFWNNAIRSSERGYRLLFTRSAFIGFWEETSRYDGLSIRCVAR